MTLCGLLTRSRYQPHRRPENNRTSSREYSRHISVSGMVAALVSRPHNVILPSTHIFPDAE